VLPDVFGDLGQRHELIARLEDVILSVAADNHLFRADCPHDLQRVDRGLRPNADVAAIQVGRCDAGGNRACGVGQITGLRLRGCGKTQIPNPIFHRLASRLTLFYPVGQPILAAGQLCSRPGPRLVQDCLMPTTLGKSEALLEAANVLIGMGAFAGLRLWLAGPGRIFQRSAPRLPTGTAAHRELAVSVKRPDPAPIKRSLLLHPDPGRNRSLTVAAR
jgi:hypothetical protein